MSLLTAQQVEQMRRAIIRSYTTDLYRFYVETETEVPGSDPRLSPECHVSDVSLVYTSEGPELSLIQEDGRNVRYPNPEVNYRKVAMVMVPLPLALQNAAERMESMEKRARKSHANKHDHRLEIRYLLGGIEYMCKGTLDCVPTGRSIVKDGGYRRDPYATHRKFCIIEDVTGKRQTIPLVTDVVYVSIIDQEVPKTSL